MATSIHVQRHWVGLAVLPLLMLVVLMPLGFLYGVGGSSEARELHVIRVIMEEGEWILPRRNGLVPSKPPLFHWVAATIGSVLGLDGPGLGRAISALFAAGMLVITMWYAYLLLRVGLQLAEDLAFTGAAMAGGILGTTYGFLRLAFDARVDMLFSFFCTLAIFVVLRAFPLAGYGKRGLHQPIRSADQWLFYGAAGCATLAKGPLGMALPLLVVISVCIYRFGWLQGLWYVLRPRWPWLLFGLIVFPWYILAAQEGSTGFINRQLLFENIYRLVGGSHINQEPPWFYLMSLLGKAAPWSVLLVLLLIATREIVMRGKAGPILTTAFGDVRKWRLILAPPMLWLVIGVLFFSIASGKRHAYLAPLYPALSVSIALLGVLWWGNLGQRQQQNWRRWNAMALGLLGLCAMIGLLLLTLLRHPVLQSSPQAVFVANRIGLAQAAWSLPFLVILGLLWLACWPHPWAVINKSIAAWSAVVLCLGTFVSLGLAAKNDLKGFHYVAIDINSKVPSTATLGVLRDEYEEYYDPVLYYLNRAVLIISPGEWSSPCAADYLIVRRDLLKSVPASGVSLLAEYDQLNDWRDRRVDRDLLLVTCRVNDG